MEKENKYSEEITLREFILKIREYFYFLWGKKLWIILAGLVGVLIGFVVALRSPVTYAAELTYMVNEDEGNTFGGAGAILSQFGLNGGASSEYNLDKIVALSKSRRILEKVLLDSTIIDGAPDLLANHLIRSLQLHDEWIESDNEELHGFYFPSDKLNTFTRTAKSAFKRVFSEVVGREKKKGIVSSGYSDDTGILRLSATTEHEDISIVIAEKLYVELAEYYVHQSTEKKRETVMQLNAKVDSINGVLQRAEYKLAQFQDRSLGVGQRRDQLEQGRLNREVQVLTIMYGEALKNRETAAFILESSTPFFQLVDGVMGPLKGRRMSKLITAVKYGVLFGFLMVGALILVDIYRKAVA